VKPLGFHTAPTNLPPVDSRRDPRAGLLRTDPTAYEQLMRHLTDGVPALDFWQGRLLAGDAVVVLTGQQPAFFGGPLYTLYKTLTAVVAARRLRSGGIPAIPAFWCVGDDTDFDEVSAASWPVNDGPPRRVRDERAGKGKRLALLGAKRMRPALEILRSDWPSATIVDRVGSFTLANYSGFLKRSLRFLCGDEPLLFVDGNDLRVIRASQPWLRGFISDRDTIADGIAEAASMARERGIEPALGGEEARRALFVTEGPLRTVLEPGAEPSPGQHLLPNVVLRPALQEHLLPVHSVVCGEGEIAYRRLLGPVYDAIGRPAAPLMHRFSATLFPPAWQRLGDRPDAWDVMDRLDKILHEWGTKEVPQGLLEEVARIRGETDARLNSLEEPLGRFDRSLPQLVDSVAGKIDFQLRRIEETLAVKGRAALYRKVPELKYLREYIRPRGDMQERSFVLWTPLLYEGTAALRDLDVAVEDWFDKGASGHALLGLEEGR
jgi:bacillithiol synthase